MSTLAYRKQYVAKCLIKGGPFTRTYDNCFERADGGEIVKYLIKRAQDDMFLKEAIKRQNTWEFWQYYAEHGTYQGLKGANPLDKATTLEVGYYPGSLADPQD